MEKLAVDAVFGGGVYDDWEDGEGCQPLPTPDMAAL
jgi:hypothetical protein